MQEATRAEKDGSVHYYVMTGFTRTVRTLWMLYLGREHLSPVVLLKSNITSLFTQERCDIIVQAKDIAQSRDWCAISGF